MIKTILNPLERFPLITDPAKMIVEPVACPLGNEYPVAPLSASFTGCTRGSNIHGR